jgi:hypothetical protein
MNIIAPMITSEFIFTCITSLSTSISSTHNLYNYVVSYSNTTTDYQSYKDKLITTDLSNKLNVTNTIIKDIIKKYHLSDYEEIEKELEEHILNNNVKVIEENDFNIITKISNNKSFPNLPDAIRVSIYSTLEIIIQLYSILEKIQSKIRSYENSYLKYFYKLNIHDEVSKIIIYNDIFEKRLGLLFEVLKIYGTIKII